MNCHDIFEALSDYLDEELALKTCREIEAHLDDCYNCQVVVDTLRKTIALYHSVPSKTVPDDVRLRLHKVIRIEE